jgi:glycosyltransferase involved in cell wall biosynthesis
MKINIVVPSTSTVMGGGIRVIFQHANYLANKGHDVVVYVPMLFFIGNRFILKTSLANTLKRRTMVNWMQCHFTVRLAWKIEDRYVRDADIVMATAWYTAPFVNALSEKKGKKVYFIQAYEVWNQDERLVDATYQMDMYRIVITQKLCNLLYDKFGVKSEIVYNGHAQEEFMKQDKCINDPKIVIMLWNSAWYKGGKQALDILTKMHDKYNIKVRLFSVEPKPDIPDFIEFYYRPNRLNLIKLYQQSDIYLFSSNQESWGLPVIEAMANKCAVVGMKTGCLEDVCEDGKQALIAECGDYENLEVKLEQVIQNDDLMCTLQQNGYDFSLQFSWDKQCALFERCLLDL